MESSEKKLRNQFTPVKRKLYAIKDTMINKIKYLRQITRYYFTFLLVIIFVFIGDILIFNALNTGMIFLSSLSSLFTILVSLNVSLFALSITIYALILKLTDGKIIGRYIQEEIEINRICGSFISSLLLFLVNYIILFSLNIPTNLLIVLFLVSPLILTIFFLLKNIIFRILPATTLNRSLDFFTNRLEQLKKEFQVKYRKVLKKALKSAKKQKTEADLYLKVGKSISIDKYLSFTIAKDFLSKYMKEYSIYHHDAINLLIEIQEKTKSNESDLYMRIGRAIAPPYITYDDFIQNNLIIPIKEIHEKFPKFSNLIVLTQNIHVRFLSTEFFFLTNKMNRA